MLVYKQVYTDGSLVEGVEQILTSHASQQLPMRIRIFRDHRRSNMFSYSGTTGKVTWFALMPRSNCLRGSEYPGTSGEVTCWAFTPRGTAWRNPIHLYHRLLTDCVLRPDDVAFCTTYFIYSPSSRNFLYYYDYVIAIFFYMFIDMIVASPPCASYISPLKPES